MWDAGSEGGQDGEGAVTTAVAVEVGVDVICFVYLLLCVIPGRFLEEEAGEGFLRVWLVRMREEAFSTAERSFVTKALEAKLRVDGRPLHEARKTEVYLRKADGCAEVRVELNRWF